MPFTVFAESLEEYTVKAGYIYKFMLFTEWPDSAFESSNSTIVLGIYGPNPFADIFEQVTGRTIQDRQLVVRYLSQTDNVDKLKHCHVLFLSRSLGVAMFDVLEKIEGAPVLTVSDYEGFIDRGGMIEFQSEDQHIYFSINRKAANKVGIRFRSQMLNIAIRVIQ
jgi:hypothetical protein